VEELSLFGPREREGPGRATERCESRDGCVNLGAREKMYVPMYEGNLDVKELLD
jgi:hypothetical protein